MKKFLSLLICCVMILSIAPTISYASDEVSVYVDGQKVIFDVQPAIINGRTFVPMRKIFEALGADVQWYPEDQCVFGTMCGIGVELYIGNTTMYINTVPKTIDVAPFIDNGRTLVPARFAAESLGATVNYDASTKSVIIESPKNLGTLTYVTSGNIRYKGQFDVTGTYPSGYGTTWNEDGSIKHSGKYEYGLYNGYGCLYNDGEIYYVGEFSSGNPTKNGKYINQTIILPDENNSNSSSFNGSSSNLEQQYIELNNWYYAELEELRNYERNCDPYETDRAYAIYDSYGINPHSVYLISYEEFRSFSSSADATRYAQSLKNKADAEIIADHQAYIEDWRSSIEDEYRTELAILDSKKAQH